MTYKRLTKAKAEKFTPQNIAYCQAFLNYMVTVPKHKVKFFDEAGLDLSVSNPVYGISKIIKELWKLFLVGRTIVDLNAFV